MPIDMKMLVFFLRKCVRTAAKTMVVDRKNQRALALLYLASGPLRNAANSSVVLTEVRSRTDNKDEVLEGKFVTWTFRLPPKRQPSILLNFFLPLIQLFLTFVAFAKMRVTMRFRAKNAGYSTGVSQVYATSSATKISWLDRLPKLLSNGAPLWNES